MDYQPVLVIVGSGIFWARAAQSENTSSVAWVALSILANLLALVIAGSLTAMLISQVLLFVAITVYRTLRQDG